jgi:hypothetical protein
MKNRNVQFKATTVCCKSSRHPAVAGFLLACSAVFIAATTPAGAGTQVPFNGTVSGYVLSQSCTDCCDPSLHVFNSGNANQLGAFTGTAEFYPYVCDLVELLPILAPFTGLRPTATKSPALSTGT